MDLEFQTTQRPDDLVRFASYNLEAYRRYRVPIHTVVLYGAGITSAPTTLAMGGLTFTVTAIFLGREDGDTVLARLRAVAAGRAFTPADRVDLILLPLMRQTRPLAQVLAEAIATTTTLPAEERAQTVGAMVGLAYTYLEQDVAVALLEALKMTNALREWLEQEIGQGIEQGIERSKVGRGERAARRLVVRSRFGAVPAALEQRITGADSATIERLLAATRHGRGDGGPVGRPLQPARSTKAAGASTAPCRGSADAGPARRSLHGSRAARVVQQAEVPVVLPHGPAHASPLGDLAHVAHPGVTVAGGRVWFVDAELTQEQAQVVGLAPVHGGLQVLTQQVLVPPIGRILAQLSLHVAASGRVSNAGQQLGQHLVYRASVAGYGTPLR